MNHSEIVSFLWGVADLIRDTFKRGKYQDVILPLTVLRRLDCVLAATKAKVLARQGELRGRGLQDLDAQLRKASGFAFYNTSRYDFDKLLADAPHLAANLRNYIAGFSPNMREVLEKFDFDNTISKLDEAGLLFQVLEFLLRSSPCRLSTFFLGGRQNAIEPSQDRQGRITSWYFPRLKVSRMRSATPQRKLTISLWFTRP